jgi:adenosylcobinamide-phosphate synthase
MVPAACLLDRLIGDPRGLPHPVQMMGRVITVLRRPLETWAGDRPGRLRWAGVLIAAVLVAGSGAAGWLIERLAGVFPLAGGGVLLLAMASTLAGRSLARAVHAVVESLPDLPAARIRLAWIVGRDVEGLPEREILRAAAETAAENAVDGLFAPLFWLLAGSLLLTLWPGLPGPLSLAWVFKAASTLDSMLGYRHGRLRWLGTAGARLDDGLTWLPCRLVALTLPLVSGRPADLPRRFRAALEEGRADPSPNAGVSQAAYAHAAGVRLGGRNRYRGELRSKPVLGPGFPPVDRAGVERILQLTDRLQLLWLALAIPVLGTVSWNLAQ